MSFIVLKKELKLKVGEEVILIPANEPLTGELIEVTATGIVLDVLEFGGKVRMHPDTFFILECLDRGEITKYETPLTLYRLWSGLEEFIATEKSIAEGDDTHTYLGSFKDTQDKIERVPVDAFRETQWEAAELSLTELRESEAELKVELDTMGEMYQLTVKYRQLAEELIKEKPKP
jgi:hypothetical protein